MSLADTFRHTEGMVRLRAKWVLPIDMPPIENGEVHIKDGEIVWVGKASSREPTADFRMAAILPGLVNVHAQLEYTALRGLLEDVGFFTSLRTLSAIKSQLSLEDWLASATLGAGEMLSAGITTVGDSADTSASLTALLTSGQRGIVFREGHGIDRYPDTDSIVSVFRRRITEMYDQIERHHAEDRVGVGIAPQSLYTVSAALFRALADFAEAQGLRQAIPVAESPAEDRLIRYGDGPLSGLFKQRGIPWTATNVSPVRYLTNCGAFAPPTLAVHCVQIDDKDIALLKENNAAVGHCPRSNGKTGVGSAPISKMIKAGISVGLGTGLAALNSSADMFEEMRAAVYAARSKAQDVAALSTREVLRMATLGGATALGLEGEIGSLRHGKRADLCVVRLDGLHMTPTADDSPEAALVYSARASDVLMTMVDGRVLYELGAYTLLDMGRLRGAVAHTRQRIKKEAAKTLASITTAASA